ncbi:hypothetical protein L7F22_067711 [Adiantum nelumboides]|nr:hypothetical protein [Adiantum nelumboides]
MENSNEHMMQQMMQQFVAFFQQQQVMQQRMNLEDRMRKARQCVIEKLDRFDGRPIEELQGQHSVSWCNFKVALKAEYFLEDSQRVTKQTFIKWVQMKNKGLTSRELLREFEKKFDQLSTVEQQSLRSEKVELFVQAADSRLQKSLVQLLEDLAGELGLTNDWDAVPATINLLVKHQKRIDKSIVVDSHEDFEENGIVEKIVEKPKASSSPTLEGKEKPKEPQSSTLDDLIKVEQETNPTNSQNILHEELEDLEEPRTRMENDVVLEAKHAHFHEDEESDKVPRSHFLRSH